MGLAGQDDAASVSKQKPCVGTLFVLLVVPMLNVLWLQQLVQHPHREPSDASWQATCERKSDAVHTRLMRNMYCLVSDRMHALSLVPFRSCHGATRNCTTEQP